MVERVIIHRAVNWTLFVVGMLIVWLSAHDFVACLGAFVASLHFYTKVESKA